MAPVAQIGDMGSLSDAETAVIAYLEAAQGDVERALAFAVGDILRLEANLIAALAAVSHGYVRGSIPMRSHRGSLGA